MNMRRKIALEIWHRRRFPDVRTGYMPPSDLEMKALLDDADGALDALMEPTNAMAIAGRAAFTDNLGPIILVNGQQFMDDLLRNVLTKMIRAAKEEPQQ